MGMKYRPSESFTEFPNGSRAYFTEGPFASISKVERCPCEDGVARNAFATTDPDTFFSNPAVVYVQSKSVSGYLSCDDDGWKFTAYSNRKNASLIVKKEQS